MEKCRICLLENKRTLMCIYESYKNVSYADMMASLANVMIVRHDGVTDKICRSCRKILQEAYDFKLLIERSDAILNGNLKKLKFNNINDIKLEVEIEMDNKKQIKKYKDILNVIDEKNEFCYSDTVITKVPKINKANNICRKPIPVLEFLKTIEDEPENDNHSDDLQDYDLDCSGVDSDDDGDYRPPQYDLSDVENKSLLERKTKRNTSETKRNTRSRKRNIRASQNENDELDPDYCETDTYYDGTYVSPHKLLKKRNYKKQCVKPQKEFQICVKPIYMKNLKLIYSKPEKQPKIKKSCKDRRRVCPYCGILTKSLKNHILVHTGERKHKCDKCVKAFFTPSSLNAHIKNSHETKEIKCDECTATFSNKALLKSHKITHRDELNYVCDICSKAYKRKTTLRRHVITHNSANKNVKCDLCNMSFWCKFGLQHHMRIHTGERPYNCEICSQPYSYKHDFNRHCLKKHGVFFKRRSVYVMNEEVLKKEKILMKELLLRVQGVIKDDKPINPFEGPQATQAFEMAIKALEARQIPIDF